jgi:hypothetical protein
VDEDVPDVVALGDAVAVALAELERVPVSLADTPIVLEGVPVGVLVALLLADAVRLGDTDDDREALPVVDALPLPEEDRDADALRLGVCDVVLEPVEVRVALADPELEALALVVAV